MFNLKKSLTYSFFAFSLLATSAFSADVSISAVNVDDKIDIYVDGEHQSSCTWAGNPGCSARLVGNLSGTHTVRFKLTNYIYDGFCLAGGCGKYAADLEITSNGTTIWSDGVYERNNNPGVKYDKTLTCNFSSGSCY